MLSEPELRKLSANLIAEPDDYMHSFRENLRMYIDKKEITLSEVAELADMSESTLKSFVYGEAKDCHLSTAVKLAHVFKVSIDELVGAGTISPQTCESLQIIRQLPKSFTHYVRFATHMHYRQLTEGSITEKAVEIAEAVISDNGGLKLSNGFSIMDISGLSEDIRTKIFMGVKIPSDLYAPYYYEDDILLLANDRNPRTGEDVLISASGNLYILKTKLETVDGKVKRNFYSIRDGKLRTDEDHAKLIIGYIVKVIQN